MRVSCVRYSGSSNSLDIYVLQGLISLNSPRYMLLAVYAFRDPLPERQRPRALPKAMAIPLSA